MTNPCIAEIVEKPGITGDPDARFMAGLLAKYSETARIRLTPLTE